MTAVRLLWCRPSRAACVVFVLAGLLTAINIFQLNALRADPLSENGKGDIQIAECEDRRPVAWISGHRIETGYLSHVVDVLELLGYRTVKGNQTGVVQFDVLWSHEYPFSKAEFDVYLKNIRPFQKWNHIPGSGYYTSKVSLSTADVSEGLPKAFVLPAGKEDFLSYAKVNPNFSWVHKGNAHRGIQIKTLDEINLDEEDSFVQQYVANPLLIDGRKFDFGIYTVITSVSPLRVYMFEGDILLRFCSKPYHPFDPKDVDKYVIGDDYTPIWEMPSLKKYYVDGQTTFREAFNAHIRSLGKEPSMIWESAKEIISQVFQSQQKNMIAAGRKFSDKRSFFELSRFDFIVDEHLNVFLMEANMSPNLSSAHFPKNRLLYEQLLLSVFSLVGVAHQLHGNSVEENFKNRVVREMQVSERDLRVFPEECAQEGGACYGRNGCKAKLKCQLCGHCLNFEVRSMLRAAYEEHLSRRMMRRVLPSATHKPMHVNRMYSQADRLAILWFDAKCHQDSAWCT